MPATIVGIATADARELIIFEGAVGFVQQHLAGVGASKMHDGMEETGKVSETSAQRRQVNADSFRRLTALLKKPQAVASFVEPTPEFAAPASNLPEAPVEEQRFEAAPIRPPEAEPAQEIEPPALAVSDSQADPIADEPNDPAQVAASVMDEVAMPPEAPAELQYLPRSAVEQAFTETPLVNFAEAPHDVPAIPIVAEVHEPEVVLPEEPAPEPVVLEATAPPPEPASDEPENFAIPLEPALAPLVQKEAATEAPQVRSRRLRQKASDAFSLIPEPAAQRAVPLSPQQEAESAELARSLMDMMAASASGGQPQERALAADTLLRLLPRLPARTRTTLAERLTMMDAPPPFLVSKLSADSDLAISGPLLEDCMHITDDNLLQLIDSGNGDKRRLIARRRRISTPVSEALAATDDASVLLTLVRNQGAEISQEGFSLLAHAAADNMEILTPLCTRQDLPVHFAFELFWLAPAQLRRYLLSRFLTDSENLTKILRITMDSHGEEQAPAPGIDLEAVGKALVRFMADDVSVTDRDEQISTLASAAKIKPATVERILRDDQGEPLMALLKVVGVPRSMMEAEMPQLTKGAQRLIDPSRSLAEVQAVFDQLSFTKARILLTYWDWATTKSGPYAAVN